MAPRPAAHVPRVSLSWADVSTLGARTGTGLVRTPRLGQRGLYRHRAGGCPHLEDSLSRVPAHRSVTRKHLVLLLIGSACRTLGRYVLRSFSPDTRPSRILGGLQGHLGRGAASQEGAEGAGGQRKSPAANLRCGLREQLRWAAGTLAFHGTGKRRAAVPWPPQDPCQYLRYS